MDNKNLEDVLLEIKSMTHAEHHGVMIAVIDSVNYDEQTVSASLVFKAVINDEEVSYPQLVDVPFIAMQGGNSGLTMPIKAGDQALILFADRNIDNWFSVGVQEARPLNNRMHSLADGIALVGINSPAVGVLNHLPDTVHLYNNENSIKLSNNIVATSEDGATLELSSKITIKNNSGSIHGILNDISERLSTLLGMVETLNLQIPMSVPSPELLIEIPLELIEIERLKNSIIEVFND